MTDTDAIERTRATLTELRQAVTAAEEARQDALAAVPADWLDCARAPRRST